MRSRDALEAELWWLESRIGREPFPDCKLTVQCEVLRWALGQSGTLAPSAKYHAEISGRALARGAVPNEPRKD